MSSPPTKTTLCLSPLGTTRLVSLVKGSDYSVRPVASKLRHSLQGIPWSLLRFRLKMAGHTRLQEIEDYDLWGYALAMIQQGDLDLSEVTK
mgnify:CR=1 FL=1